MSNVQTQPDLAVDEGEGTIRQPYTLPKDLVRAIRLEAADLGVWPSEVLRDRIADHMRRYPMLRRTSK